MLRRVQMGSEVEIAIVGSGFSGLAMSRRLRRDGVEDFVILEKASDVGGTWRDNDYPGCACDVPSHLYSYSFAGNPDWPDTFSGQGEIWAYLRDCVVRFGLEPHLRLAHSVHNAVWDEATTRWRLTTSD